MPMGKVFLEVDTCITCLLIMQKLFVITTMDLAIVSLSARRGTCSHMGSDKMALLYKKVKTKHMERKYLHGKR